MKNLAASRRGALIVNSSKIEHALLYGAAFFFPFELLIAEGAHGLLAGHIGSLYLLFHPYTILAALALLQAVRRGSLKRHVASTIAGWTGLLVLGVVVGSLNGGAQPGLTLGEIWFGCFSIWVFFTIVANDKDDRFLIALTNGIVCWAVLCIAAYIYAVILLYPPIMANYSWPQIVLAMHSPGLHIPAWKPFDVIAGNVNKVANVLVVGTLLSAFLHVRRRSSSLTTIARYLPLGLAQFLMFSRGAFVVNAILAAIAIVFRLTAQKRPTTINQQGLAFLFGMLLIPVVASFSTPAFIHYWTDFYTVSFRLNQWDNAMSKRFGDAPLDVGDVASENKRDTAAPPDARRKIFGKAGAAKSKRAPAASVNEKKTVLEKESCLSIVLGCGPGNYGESRYGDVNRTTHNLYLDTVFSAGLTGLVALLAVFLWPLASVWKSGGDAMTIERLFGLLGLVAIMILGMREYALAYLYVTAMGGAMLGLFSAFCLRAKPVKSG